MKKMKLKLLVLGTMISGAFLAQDLKKIEVGLGQSGGEVRETGSGNVGPAKANTSKTSITWRLEDGTWATAKRPSLSGVNQYLSKYESSNKLLIKSQNQFRIGLFGTGAVYTGLAVVAVGIFTKPKPTDLNPNPSMITPLAISGAIFSVAGGIVGTIFKTKGYNTLKKSVEAYNEEITKSGFIIKSRPIYSCSLGFQTGLPSLGFKMEF
jgi:hypothetical protein